MKKGFVLDLFFFVLTFLAAFLVILLAVGIFISLFKEAYPAISKFGFLKFVFSTAWDPVAEKFGAAPALVGTLLTSFLSIIIAVPIAIGIAIFITEIAPPFLKGIIGTAIELLAAIPSIIYGMWGLFTLAPIMAKYIEPFLQKIFSPIPLLHYLFQGTPMGIDLLTASVILSIMIIPFTASVARDSFELTPRVLKESAYAMGATHWEVVKDVVYPYSKLGVYGGVGLSLGRALGETMAVAFVLGNINRFPHSLFDATCTVTVKLANEFTEADSDVYLGALFYLALLLFVMSFFILALAKYIMMKMGKRYEV